MIVVILTKRGGLEETTSVCVSGGGVLRHDPCKSSMGKHGFHGFKSSQFAIETTIDHDHLGELILVAIRRHKSIRLEHAHCCQNSIFVCVCVCSCLQIVEEGVRPRELANAAKAHDALGFVVAICLPTSHSRHIRAILGHC
jgi:hypothetical protein